MAVWGVVNQKGGVGKTTTSVNLGYALAQLGQRVLLIDADPQGNATTGLGVEKTSLGPTLFDLLVAAADQPICPQTAIISVADRLDLIPATLDLAGAEPVLMGAVGKELMLREAIEAVRGDYDWILIDAPPSLGLLTVNVLAACDQVLVPMQCEFYALEGLSQLLKTQELVRKRVNPGLEIGKVVLTMYDTRNRLTEQVANEVRAFFGDKVARTTIPRNVRLSEAPGFGEPAVKRYPESKGAQAYFDLAREVSAP
ncbi:MAG: ParA family protein [Fimbriimonadaceae bacterium]